MFNLKAYSKSLQMEKDAGRKRIKDRGIKWEEAYHDRHKPLKKRFNKEIGLGSYYRWEGHDYTTDGDYFIVVGPAVTREGKKRFFSGIKKLPDDPGKKVYAPSGEYFTTISSALSHASQKWGVPFPRNQHNYTINDLANVAVSRHVRGSEDTDIKES